MARLNLIGGAYSARSVIANAQKCINYFPEINRRDAPVAMTHYQRPGRRQLVQAPGGGRWRGIYRASNGNGYGVCAQGVYSIGPGWVLTQIGQLAKVSNSQVSFTDNGVDIFLVDGSIFGYTIHLSNNTFAQIFDPTGSFTGATQVATLDTFCLFNYPGTKNFGSTLSNTISFNALYIASKTSYPDPIQGVWVNRRELILFGQLKSEIWYDVGGTSFPFAILPGAYIEHGLLAPFSLASADIETFWLSQSLGGAYEVLKLRGYDVSKISNFALDWRLKQLAQAGNDLSGAIGFTWQQGGHAFYSLNLPTPGGETWVYDQSLGDDPTLAWHQEATYVTGQMTGMRDNCAAFLYGRNVVGDIGNGWLYEMDPNYYYDDMNGVATPITCTRSFPHIIQAYGQEHGFPYAQALDTDGKRVKLSNFRLDLEVGLGVAPSQSVGLRWSWDRGQTFGNVVLQDAGSPGAYMTQPLWSQIGASGRDCILEVVHSIAGPAALQGGWIDAQILNM